MKEKAVKAIAKINPELEKFNDLEEELNGLYVNVTTVRFQSTNVSNILCNNFNFWIKNPESKISENLMNFGLGKNICLY